MGSIRRCPTCNVIFPTIDGLNDHYKLTSHMPLAYSCESCQRAFQTLSGLQNHNKSKHRQPKIDGKRPVLVSAEVPVALMDGSDTRSDSDLKSDLYLNRASGSKLPLNSPDNTDYPFTCPGCRKGFKLFSGFVLHIENRSCKSSMCHEIEDRINTCATQLFDTFTCDGI